MAAIDLSALWQVVQARLDAGLPSWRGTIEHFGQVAAAEQRALGLHWTDDDVFESLLRAVLSNNTDWAKVEKVLPELREVFNGFSLSRFAAVTEQDVIERIVPWFKARGASSMTLKRSLVGLAETSRILKRWSDKHGLSDHYFTSLVHETGDPKAAVMALGSCGSPRKLPALGVPIAAEAMRNLGYDVVKPDRHVCRAAGSFGLVEFGKWPDRSGTTPPEAAPHELLQTMTEMERFARVAGVRPTFLDNAVWLLCAKMGLYLSNECLRELGRSIST